MYFTNRNALPVLVNLVSYIGIIFSFIFDLVFFHVLPNGLQSAGIIIMVVTNITIVIYNLRLEKEEYAKQTEEKAM